MRLLLAFALAIGIGACGSTSGAGSSGAGKLSPPPAEGPRLVRFAYQVRDHQLIVTARDPTGQVIGLALEGPIMAMADGACGLHGRHSGQTSRFTLPARTLRSGRHRFTVRLTASNCRPQPKLRESTSRVNLDVAPDGSATAKDSRGIPLSP